MDKENITATPTFTRKRAKSFSTPPTVRAVTKSSRGILKGNNNGDDAHTIAFIPIHSPSKKRSESAEKRRKSLNRRVSFASHASVRLFEKPGESPPQTTPRRSTRTSPAKSPIVPTVQQSPSRSPKAQTSMDDSNDEITMDLTNVFTQLSGKMTAKQSNPLSQATPMSDDDDDLESDSDESDGHSNASEDETAAMDLTDILPPGAEAQTRRSPRKHSPLLSRMTEANAVLEDGEDDASMDMTRTVGSVHPVLDPSSPFASGNETIDNMEMTRIVGGIIRAAQSPSKIPLAPNSSLLNARLVGTDMQQSASDNHFAADQMDRDDDETVNMDETRIVSGNQVGPSPGETVDEPTSHTSYTVATEEDETQRLCEGSVTQADGFTQNMDFTRALPTTIKTSPEKKSLMSNGLGFDWGSTVPSTEDVSMMDVSMADVTQQTQNDETMNMDMTQAVPTHIFGGSASLLEDSDNHEEVPELQPATEDDTQSFDMDLTRVLPDRLALGTPLAASAAAHAVVSGPSTPVPNAKTPETPTAKVLGTPSQRLKSASPSKKSPAKRRLSSGPIRSPVVNARTSPRKSASTVSTPIAKATATTPLCTPVSRRKSLLDNPTPAFGSPDSRVMLEAGSAQKPEFGFNLVNGNDMRVTMLKEKIQALTPRKAQANVSDESPVISKDLPVVNSPMKRARFATPSKTPERSLLAPHASIQRTIPITPARGTVEAPLSPIVLKDFLKMTGISFLTGLSTTRRRETIVLPAAKMSEQKPEDAEVEALFAEKFTVPMLEMYQHSCRELTRYITEGRAMCDEIESDMNEQNPEIFDQYRRADAAGKREFEAKFKALKTTSRLSAKGVWYVWRENLLSGVLVPLKKNLAELQKECDRLEGYKQKITPQLAQVKEEYEQLKVVVDEMLREEDLYESYDHEGAARLIQQTAEEKLKLEKEAAELQQLQKHETELRQQLIQMEQEYEAQLAHVTQLEKRAEATRGYSDEEIAELKHKIDTMTQETGMKLLHVDLSSMTLLYRNSLSVQMSLPDLRITISLTQDVSESHSDVVKKYYHAQLSRSLLELDAASTSYRDRLVFIKDQWSAVLTLLTEMELLEGMYPIEVKVNEDDNLDLTAFVLLPASRSKFLARFTSTPTLTMDDCSLDVSVDVKYGGLDGVALQKHIQSRLLKQSPQLRSSGWLRDSLKLPDGL